MGVVKSNPPLQLARTGCFVPSRMRTSLRFCITATNAASTSYAQLVVSGNGLFDPGLSLSAGQPVGFDYWAAMYERYRVIGSRCHLTASLADTSTGSASVEGHTSIVLYPSNASGSLSSLDDAASQPYATRMEITSAKPISITKTMKTSVITGIKDMLGSDQLQALISGTPGNEWFWNVGVVSTAAYADGRTEISFVITYDVEFFDRAQINRSTLAFIHKAYIANCIHIEKRLVEEKELSRNAVARFELEKSQLQHEMKLDAMTGCEPYAEKKGVITGDIDSPVMVSVTEAQTEKKVPLSVKLPQSGKACVAFGKVDAPDVRTPSSSLAKGVSGRILPPGHA